MVVLALETVTRAGSVALLIDDVCHTSAGDASRTHGERLPGELLELLARHGHALAGVDRFAVIAGPGSFTGLRIGMAAIQGLAIASGRTVVPMATLDAMAQAWISRRATRPALVVACLDGQRGEVFSAAWRVPGTVPAEISAADLVIEPRVGAPEILAENLRAAAGGAAIVVVGSGGVRHAAVFGRDVEIVDVPTPLAEVAARHAARHPELAVRPHALRPNYIRQPDAVIARERAGVTGPPSAS